VAQVIQHLAVSGQTYHRWLKPAGHRPEASRLGIPSRPRHRLGQRRQRANLPRTPMSPTSNRDSRRWPPRSNG
jgi:hypothetical protein